MKLNTPKIVNMPNEETRKKEKNIVKITMLVEDVYTGQDQVILGVWYSDKTPVIELAAIAKCGGQMLLGMIQDVEYVLEEEYRKNKKEYAKVFYIEDADVPAGHFLEQVRQSA